MANSSAQQSLDDHAAKCCVEPILPNAAACMNDSTRANDPTQCLYSITGFPTESNFNWDDYLLRNGEIVGRNDIIRTARNI
jgi:pyruvate-formate lyase